MKKLFTLIMVMLVTFCVYAQSPQKMTYQAIIRNSSNGLITSSPVGMRVSILQGSATGILVYQEIYNPNPQTDANGLVTVEIGGGIPLAGTFGAIDWSAGTYFIKTETDPTGGTNYTITGTSQLLSVPYSLYAKTVTTNANLTGEVISVGNATTVTNSSVLGKLLTGFTSATGAILPADNILQAIQKLNGNTTHSIGESYGGGIVFYVYDNGQHGLIAATVDQSAGIQWNNGVSRATGSNGDGVGSGAMNTSMIVAIQISDNQTGDFAAKVCADYSVTVGDVTYGDWYLPSKFELNLLYLQKTLLGSTGKGYWSSTEIGANSSWVQLFSDGGIMGPPGTSLNSFKSDPAFVRAIRRF